MRDSTGSNAMAGARDTAVVRGLSERERGRVVLMGSIEGVLDVYG
jgi:hypothetical protein